MPDLLDVLCRKLVRHGDLTIRVGTDGEPRRYGDGTKPAVAIRLADRRTSRAIAIDPSLAVGEAYMRGRLIVEQGGVYDLLGLLMMNQMEQPAPAWIKVNDRLRHVARRARQFNGPSRAVRNVAHHYDLPDAFYELFLDTEKQYSCAYFRPGDDLDAAQRAKMRHITAKLRLSPGHRVLDIGCGWGGLALYMTAAASAHVTGITLSRRQLEAARSRSWREGAAQRVSFEFQDWRTVEGRFDRIVSVGMLEHVGVSNYAAYFSKIASSLTADGVALVHTIGRSDGPGFTNPFIARYIFPGGYFPALSELLPAIERSGLMLSDVEVLRLHYAETLEAWRERFTARWSDAVAIAGLPFCRAWEFYLAGCEAAFRHQKLVVFQLQLASRIETLPITREYMVACERALERGAAVGPVALGRTTTSSES